MVLTAVLLVPALSMTGLAQAGECADVAGVWSGNMSGSICVGLYSTLPFNGTWQATIDENCTVDISLMEPRLDQPIMYNVPAGRDGNSFFGESTHPTTGPVEVNLDLNQNRLTGSFLFTNCDQEGTVEGGPGPLAEAAPIPVLNLWGIISLMTSLVAAGSFFFLRR
jgi:hypothetical protein